MAISYNNFGSFLSDKNMKKKTCKSSHALSVRHYSVYTDGLCENLIENQI